MRSGCISERDVEASRLLTWKESPLVIRNVEPIEKGPKESKSWEGLEGSMWSTKPNCELNSLDPRLDSSTTLG